MFASRSVNVIAIYVDKDSAAYPPIIAIFLYRCKRSFQWQSVSGKVYACHNACFRDNILIILTFS